jgi:hypothetical protein
VLAAGAFLAGAALRAGATEPAAFLGAAGLGVLFLLGGEDFLLAGGLAMPGSVPGWLGMVEPYTGSGIFSTFI